MTRRIQIHDNTTKTLFTKQLTFGSFYNPTIHKMPLNFLNLKLGLFGLQANLEDRTTENPSGEMPIKPSEINFHIIESSNRKFSCAHSVIIEALPDVTKS